MGKAKMGGSSEYLQREEAAKKQLGKKGVQKRVKQLPRAAKTLAGAASTILGLPSSKLREGRLINNPKKVLGIDAAKPKGRGGR